MKRIKKKSKSSGKEKKKCCCSTGTTARAKKKYQRVSILSSKGPSGNWTALFVCINTENWISDRLLISLYIILDPNSIPFNLCLKPPAEGAIKRCLKPKLPWRFYASTAFLDRLSW